MHRFRLIVLSVCFVSIGIMACQQTTDPPPATNTENTDLQPEKRIDKTESSKENNFARDEHEDDQFVHDQTNPSDTTNRDNETRTGKENTPQQVPDDRNQQPNDGQHQRDGWIGEETVEALLSNSLPQPTEWGETVSGVMRRMDTDDQVIALTFDACGGPTGSEYDQELIDFLIAEQVPATLFINARWIDENADTFNELANNDLFLLANHGTEHRPLSVSGGTAWGIKGTTDAASAVQEVVTNHNKMLELTGEAPAFYRSGTAYYDEVAVHLIRQLGIEIVNYDILGDAGATYSAQHVHQALLQSEPGSIALLHMNQPSSETAQGVMQAVPELRAAGYTFVHIDAYPLSE